jgi:hypothetical protein
MKTKRLMYSAVAILCLMLLASCSEDNPVNEYSLGSIDPSMYVAIGCNYTAGMQSGALFEEAQMYSFPNLIARQLRTDMAQPLMPYPERGSCAF